MANDTPPQRPAKPARIGRFKIGLNVLAQIIVAVLILFMLNFFAFNHYRRWDFSRTHFFSLSDKTWRVLAGLKKPVKIIVFFPTASDISDDVNNLLKEYQYASNGKMEVEIVDPYRNQSRAEELQHLYKFGANENLVILNCDDRKKFVNAIDMADLDTSGACMPQPTAARSLQGRAGHHRRRSSRSPMTSRTSSTRSPATANATSPPRISA